MLYNQRFKHYLFRNLRYHSEWLRNNIFNWINQRINLIATSEFVEEIVNSFES